MKWLRVFEFISPSSIYSKLWALDCPAHLRLTSLRKILFQSVNCAKEKSLLSACLSLNQFYCSYPANTKQKDD